MPRGPKGEKRPADVLGRRNQTETRPGGEMLQFEFIPCNRMDQTGAYWAG